MKKKFTLAKITEELEKDINKGIEGLKYDNDKRKMIQYLKGSNFVEKANKAADKGENENNILDTSSFLELEDFERKEYLKKIKLLHQPSAYVQ